MPLSCSCSYDDAPWFYFHPEDYSVMPPRARRCRCSSCRELIDAGATVAAFERSRPTCSDVEDSIWGGDDVPMATWFLCERCTDLYFSLYELGFQCVAPDDDMREMVQEYAALYGTKRAG